MTHLQIGNAEKLLAAHSFKTMNYEQDNKLFYGVELELEVKSPGRYVPLKYSTGVQEAIDAVGARLAKSAILKPEGSIDDGFEIVTVPATLDYHREILWGRFFDEEAKLMKASPRTGMHVHFSRNALSVKQLAKAMIFIHDPDHQIFLTKIAGRTVSPTAWWCRIKTKDKSAIRTEEGQKRIVDSEYTSDRGAMTISTHNQGRSVECRIFQAVTTYAGVMQALEFLDALIKYCGECGETVEDLSYKTFVHWASSFSNKKEYPHLFANLVKKGLATDKLITLDDIKNFVKTFRKVA